MLITALGERTFPAQRPRLLFPRFRSLCRPANEQATLAEIVEWTIAELKQLTGTFEVIVVDDGSTDRTGRIADYLARKDPRMRALHNPAPSGFGGLSTPVFRPPDTILSV